MIHPWYLNSQPPYLQDLLEICLSGKDDIKVAKELQKHVNSMKDKLPKTLFNLIIRGLYLCINKPTKKSGVFLSEICAAFEFQYKNPNAGKLDFTTSILETNPFISHHIVDRCCEIKDMNPCDGKQWFNLRIAIMDACTAAKMLSSQTYWNIFYGGETHAKNIGEILSIEGICKNNTSDELDHMKHYVSSCSTIVNTCYPKKYTILGETHSRTDMDFATKLLHFCNEKCYKKEEKVSVFIEKHPSNGIDYIQQDLTCNMQEKLPIQNFRCNYPICESVNVYDVDVRHIELGFLRYEFLGLDTEDSEFQDLSYKFQDECVTHILSLATIFM